MDATLKLTNVKKSLKKYFLYFFTTTNNVKVIYDKWLVKEYLATQTAGKWIFINFGEPIIATLSSLEVTLIACSKGDPEGVELSKLQDFIVECLTDTTSDRKIVDFYNTYTSPWTLIGGIVIKQTGGGKESLGDENVNVSVINVRAKWGAKT